jgi:lysyl-tRNA synthetase class 1
VTYGLLLNLVGVLGAHATRDQVWSYLGNYIGDADPATIRSSTCWSTCALAYNRDSSRRRCIRRKPEANEAAALPRWTRNWPRPATMPRAEDLQNIVYEIGKDPHYGFENLRDWFKALYETLLGSSQGPRMGSFIALYGVANTTQDRADCLGEALVVRSRWIVSAPIL